MTAEHGGVPAAGGPAASRGTAGYGRRTRGALRLVPRLARDAWTRALLALGAGVLVTLPLVPVLRSGSPAPPVASAAVPAAAAAMEPALSLSLALAAVLLAAGTVSEPLREGWCRTVLVRPVWRPGWFLARFAGALAWCPAVGLALHAVLDLLAGPGRLPVGTAATVPGALAWAAVAGAPTFAFSCLLRRGDGLAATATLLVPALLASLGEVGSRPLPRALAAAAPPVGAARDVVEAGLSGLVPPSSALAAVAAHAAGWLLVGLAVLTLRRLTPG